MGSPRYWKAYALWAAVGAVFCGTLWLQGCRETAPEKTPLTRAWGHCESGEFAAAFPLLRDYLSSHPEDAAGHYLLGKCYSNRTPRELTRAKGEFDMARFLNEEGSRFEIPGVAMSREDFLAETHYETARVLLFTALEANKAGISPRASVGILRTALEHAHEGRKLNPASSRLAELNSVIEEAIQRASANEAFPGNSLPKTRYI